MCRAQRTHCTLHTAHCTLLTAVCRLGLKTRTKRRAEKCSHAEAVICFVCAHCALAAKLGECLRQFVCTNQSPSLAASQLRPTFFPETFGPTYFFALLISVNLSSNSNSNWPNCWPYSLATAHWRAYKIDRPRISARRPLPKARPLLGERLPSPKDCLSFCQFERPTGNGKLPTA